MVEVINYMKDTKSVIVRFWWSDKNGLTCDNTVHGEIVKSDGIMVPSKGWVFPKDGKNFFDALPFYYNGVTRAQPPVTVTEQGGKPIT